MTLSLEAQQEQDEQGQESSLGLQLRVPTAMAERQGQDCHHPGPHPALPDSGTEPGPISPGFIFSPAQTVHGSEGGRGWVGRGFLRKLLTGESS